MSGKRSLNQTRQRYNEKIEKARIEYLDSSGKKIARGFKESEEYKKLLKSKRRAEQRIVKALTRDISSKIDKQRDAKGAAIELIDKSEIAQDRIKNVFFPANNIIFHRALSYGGSEVRQVEQLYLDAEGQGKRVIVTMKFPNGKSYNAYSLTSFHILVQRLYNDLLELQSEQDSYPGIDITTYEDKSGNFYIYIAESGLEIPISQKRNTSKKLKSTLNSKPK